MPFPIIVADMVSDNENTTTIIDGDEVPLTNPLIEFSPCTSNEHVQRIGTKSDNIDTVP